MFDMIPTFFDIQKFNFHSFSIYFGNKYSFQREVVWISLHARKKHSWNSLGNSRPVLTSRVDSGKFLCLFFRSKLQAWHEKAKPEMPSNPINQHENLLVNLLSPVSLHALRLFVRAGRKHFLNPLTKTKTTSTALELNSKEKYIILNQLVLLLLLFCRPSKHKKSFCLAFY